MPARPIARLATLPFPHCLDGAMHLVGELLLCQTMPLTQTAPVVGSRVADNEGADALAGHCEAGTVTLETVGAAPGRSGAGGSWQSHGP